MLHFPEPAGEGMRRCHLGRESMSDRSLKITVTFESRPDGGLRVWSADVPGLILSHTDVDGILADIPVAIKTILSQRLSTEIEVFPLTDVRSVLQANGMLERQPFTLGPREYVAYCH
jgi:hypothetical protein